MEEMFKKQKKRILLRSIKGISLINYNEINCKDQNRLKIHYYMKI